MQPKNFIQKLRNLVNSKKDWIWCLKIKLNLYQKGETNNTNYSSNKKKITLTKSTHTH